MIVDELGFVHTNKDNSGDCQRRVGIHKDAEQSSKMAEDRAANSAREWIERSERDQYQQYLASSRRRLEMQGLPACSRSHFPSHRW
jgi:hypothetical protein